MLVTQSPFSVVIPTYNGKEFLRKALWALEKSVLRPIEIVVVDDFSSDGTKEVIKNEFKFVRYIRNNKNLGPPTSRNRGAAQSVGEYIIFLDNDVLVKPNTLERLVSFMEKNPKCGLVGAKLILGGEEKMWWNMGYDFNHFRTSIGYLFGLLLKFFPNSERLKNGSMRFILNYWDYNRTIEVGWVIESCFAVRKDLFDLLGGFDEKFFVYHEGPDLCRRIRNLGYKVYFYPEAEVDVLEGHTHSLLKRGVSFLKSDYYYYKKHYFYTKSNPIFYWIGRITSWLFRLLG